MTPRLQLDAFLRRFAPEIVRTARAALARVRSLTPGATELVYDNYRGLVVGFGPTERPSEAVLSIAIYAGKVVLCFIQNGPRIPDPKKLLRGSGNVARNVPLESAKTLDQPAVLRLIAAAKSLARVPFDPSKPRQLIIRSVSAAQLPRRPAAARSKGPTSAPRSRARKRRPS